MKKCFSTEHIRATASVHCQTSHLQTLVKKYHGSKNRSKLFPDDFTMRSRDLRNICERRTLVRRTLDLKKPFLYRNNVSYNQMLEKDL